MFKTTDASSSLMAKLGPSHASLLLLAHYTQSIVVLCDDEGKLVYLNPAGRKVISIDEADIYPQHMTGDILLSQRDTVWTEIIAIARDQGVWQGRMKLANGFTGAFMDMQRSTFRIQDAARKVTGFVSVIDPIAEEDAAHAVMGCLAAGAGSHSAAGEVDPVEQLIHDLNNMVAAVLSGFAMIERRSQDASVQAIAAAGKKAAQEGLQVANRLKVMVR